MRTAGICLFLAAALALPLGCNNGGSSSDGTVSMTASQQGTSGGLADYDGDGVDDLFVGAPYAEGSNRMGAVLVYKGDSIGFASQPTWTLTGDDNFGYRFAVVGDLTGDGIAEYAVTAINGDGADASLSGSVTVYQGGAWGHVLKKLGGEQAMDKFGYSLTGECDLNSDSVPDLVIGAISHSPGPDRYLGGAVYIYFGPELTEAERVKLEATTHTGILGFSSTCGDINNDAVDDLVVSAIWTHGVIWHESQVLAYYGGTGFSPETDSADVTIESTASHFGDALEVLDDLNGDGYNEIAIGVPSLYAIPFPMPHHKGMVWVISGGTGSRTIDMASPGGSLITAIYGEANLELFGSSLATLEDLDSDGVGDLAVGAIHASAEGATNLENGLLTGKVFVFKSRSIPIDGSPIQATAASTLSRSDRDLHYGSFLAPFNKGGPRLLVGAPTADRHTGAVFLEDL